MASTYSPALRLELMATGDQSGTWGDTTNTNLGTLLEQAITGYLSVAQGDVANLTLTTTNGASDQARNAVIRITGALTATRNVVIQTANKMYTIANDTTGGFSIVVKTSAGTGVSVPPGAMMNIYSDGTNAVMGQNYWNGSIGGAVYLDAGAAVGPNYDLFRDSASPAVSDILGRITFNGRDSAGSKQEYASIETTIVSPTSTTEAGALDFYAVKAGARTRMATIAAAGTAFTGAAAYSFDAATTISSTAAGTLLTVTSTDAGASIGPSLDLYRDSATPAANDLGPAVIFNGEDSAGNKQEYAAAYVRINDPTSGSEDGTLIFEVVKAGSVVNHLTLGSNAAGTATPNAIGLTLGQLSFPAAQNPSTDANTLDDYEEVSWTPVLTFATAGDLSVSYSVQAGRAIKVGKQVSLMGSITTSAFTHTTASGALTITGQPFTADTIAGMEWIAAFSFQGITKAGYSQFAPRIQSAGTTITVVASNTGSARAAVDAADMPTGGTVVLNFGVIYQAAA